MRRALSVLIVAVALSGCGYNEMVTMKEQVDSAWAQVQNQLQRRNDLIPNLVEVAKGYAAHEKDVFTAVADARSRLLAAGTRDEQIDAANQVSGALGRLLALRESYPELKANEQFNRLSDELAGTENRIAVERQRYNDAIQDYNTYIGLFPNNIVANIAGFKRNEAYFKASEASKEVPKVEFPPPNR